MDTTPVGACPVSHSDYAAECEEFLRVAAKMAGCTWTREEHAWLSRRNRSALMATEPGRRELAGIDGHEPAEGRTRTAATARSK